MAHVAGVATGEGHRAGESRASKPVDPATAARTQARRADRVRAGVAELDRWLADQVRQGLAGASRAGYQHWDAMAARLVDAQAPGLASAVRRLAAVASTPDRLLAELGLLRLLVAAYQRVDELPADLADTVRARVGFPVATEEVLAGQRVRDEWTVVGVRDDGEDRLTVRRTWLSGSATGRPALVLAFAPAGQPLAADLVLGTSVDADLCFYPGRGQLRALVAQRYGQPANVGTPPGARGVAHARSAYADAIAADPWLDRFPVLLADVALTRDPGGGWHAGADDASMPLDPAVGTPWRLVAAAGGAPLTLAGEWTTAGLRPLTGWVDERLVRA